MAFKSKLLDTWRDNALCHSLVYELGYFTQKELYKLFFPTRHSNAAATRAAKAICSHCPVQKQCRSYALSTGDKFGVQGGLTADDRRQYRSKRHIEITTSMGEVEDYLHQPDPEAEVA